MRILVYMHKLRPKAAENGQNRQNTRKKGDYYVPNR